MSAPHPETGIRGSIGAAWQRCRDWFGWGSAADFKYLEEQDVERMAHDAGLTTGEFQNLVRRGPHSADLLLKRLAALDLDKNEILKVEPHVFRDLQRVCTMCEQQGRCRYDLKHDPNDPTWKNYCPNTETLKDLDALPWASRIET
jgi:hypothetical protein